MFEIEVKDLRYVYDGSDKKALDGVSFSVNKGEFVGIIGPNGSGKTTLVKSLTAVLQYQGSVKVKGKEVKEYSKRELAKLIGVASQEFSPAYDMKAREIVEMGRIPYTGLLGKLSKEDEIKINKAFEELGIKKLADRMFYSLSGGERQMVYVAKVFAQDPDILVLDEATAHLDIGHVEIILNRIMKVFRREGKTVIATFHDVNQAAAFSDKVIVMKDGKVLCEGSPSEVFNEEMMYTVYGARCSVVRHPKTGRINVLMDLEDEQSCYPLQDISNRSTKIQRV